MDSAIADHGIRTNSLDTGSKLNIREVFNLRPVSRKTTLKVVWKNLIVGRRLQMPLTGAFKKG